MMVPTLGQPQTCPTAMWPKVIGGAGGDTQASTLDIKAGKMAVMTDSSDPTILGVTPTGANGRYPVAHLYSLAAANLLWAKYITISDYGAGIALSNDASKVVLHTWSTFSVALLNCSDGSLLR
jgi:hypothetical protein